ncbi:thioredoxin family protein [Skermanella mucosa]|uniref:protein-disulfide reductase DsbD family protein n=1 Tax=Skermanella mucosa TaxID=1789672 RepID=UPI00192CC3BB|nr:protein-disulfide reductase DsbD domain-containing protein [Skermanella mucosa]UEM21385.1 thioredoxin family protein [Skermanella mucosa]
MRNRMTAGLGIRSVAAVLATAAAWFGSPAAATIGEWSSHDTLQARLVSPVEAVGDRETIPVGLHLMLADGWKTYWRSPGDAGAPPTVDWSASANVAGVDWRWPAPHRFTLFGLETFGYDREVVFPLDIRVERQGEPVVLRGRADVLVCSTVCIPVSLEIALDLPSGPAAADAEAANLVARFEAQVPDDGVRSGLEVEAASVETGKPGALAVRIASSRPMVEPDVLVEGGDWTFGKPEISFAPDGRGATARLPVTSGPDLVTMPGRTFVVTVTDGPRAAEARVTVAASKTGGTGIGDLTPILLLALLGGLVLNLMPCVLPVLSLKLLSVIDRRDTGRRRVRLGFLTTAAGVMTSMLLLAGMLIGLKLAGSAVGWGVQFQQPLFLVAMAAVLVAFSASLAGGLDIPLPSRLATVLGRAGGSGHAGDFATGAFATLLATPCSAPFVGTAVGFALARGPVEILTIFAALGVGLASPYLLVAAFPRLVSLMPRPGRWMAMLRRVLAVALLGTAAWLLAVLAAQTSWQAAFVIAGTLAVLGAALILRNRLGFPATLGLVAVSLSAAVASPALLSEPAETTGTAAAWAPFDQVEIGRLVAQGRTVFVDVTADWCITCQANKSLVIDRGKVADALAAPGVVPMRADWTRPDPRISDYLARNDRYGIPFNAVYGPGAPSGIILPELLSTETVLDALGRARDASTLNSQNTKGGFEVNASDDAPRAR